MMLMDTCDDDSHYVESSQDHFQHQRRGRPHQLQKSVSASALAPLTTTTTTTSRRSSSSGKHHRGAIDINALSQRLQHESHHCGSFSSSRRNAISASRSGQSHSNSASSYSHQDPFSQRVPARRTSLRHNPAVVPISRRPLVTYANIVDSAHKKNVLMANQDENSVGLASSTLQKLLWRKLQTIFDGDVTPEQLRLIRAPVLSQEEIEGDLELYSGSSSSSDASSADPTPERTPVHTDDDDM